MLFSFENIYRQYLLCRRNKRNTTNALRFEMDQEKNLLDLKEALETRTYRPARSVCFFATKPKLREIFAADFRDRVVHHILVDHLEKTWEPIFIHDSYACRKGKGVHQGVLRLQHFIRKVTQNGTRPAYFLQLDIRNYFMSIDKDILFSLMAPKVDEEDVLWLLRLLIYHDCTSNYHFRGDAAVLRKIPPHKSLFKIPANKGLPIGNLNSQFFANVYLNALNQLSASLASYLGHFKMANTFKLCQSLWARYPFLFQYFEIDLKNKKLKRKYLSPKGFRRTSQQYLYYRWRFAGAVVLFQVGHFFEFYSRHDKEVGRLLGLSEITDQKDQKKTNKRRRGLRYGFPVKRLHPYLQRLFRHQLSVVVVLEKERYISGIKERVPMYRFEPLAGA